MAYTRVLLYCWGTRGDVQPLLALALRLRELGKDVALFVTPPSDDIVKKAGIHCVVATEDVSNLLNALGSCDLSNTSVCGLVKIMKVMKAYQASPEYKAAIEADTKAAYELAVSFKPDVILTPGYQYGAFMSLGEALGIPVLRFDLQPNYPTSEIGFFKKEDGTFPACMLKFIYRTFNKLAIAKAQWPRAMEIRKLAGLPLTRHRDGSRLTLPPDVPQLCAVSPSFLPQPTDWPAFKEMSGYWFMKSPEYTPPAGLAAFLEAGDAPVYIGFGSMKGNEAFCRKLSTVAVAALRLAGRRGILLGGWAGLTAQVLDTSTEEGEALATYAGANIFEMASCPHDWLFPRCAAVVHHGGAGTLSAGLLAGKPTIICAILGDQPWHGSLVAKKGLGLYAGPIGKVTADRLGKLITQVFADPAIAKQASEISEAIRAEDGPLRVHEAIERAIESYEYPWPLTKPQSQRPGEAE